MPSSGSGLTISAQECVVLAMWLMKLTLKIADDDPENLHAASLGFCHLCARAE